MFLIMLPAILLWCVRTANRESEMITFTDAFGLTLTSFSNFVSSFLNISSLKRSLRTFFSLSFISGSLARDLRLSAECGSLFPFLRSLCRSWTTLPSGFRVGTLTFAWIFLLHHYFLCPGRTFPLVVPVQICGFLSNEANRRLRVSNFDCTFSAHTIGYRVTL